MKFSLNMILKKFEVKNTVSSNNASFSYSCEIQKRGEFVRGQDVRQPGHWNITFHRYQEPTIHRRPSAQESCTRTADHGAVHWLHTQP